ncbi:uncharacterized protein LOC115573086 [Sparus aurata]|uniref:uncharacterized protein LOC115573086 n=1 Tax=Sparus aurata TaxID=8175 RepID=UPI0011C0DA4B|nr:uncharacterized protein LOC115573086 [Sparus aurata]
MRVSVSLVFATLLCFTTWMNSDHKPHTPLVMCCAYWSKTKIPLTRIANYTIQSEGICPIAAIRFVTTIGKIICSDPDSGWAKKAKLKVDKEERKNKLPENGQNDEGATSNITPATVTTSTYTMQRFHTNTGGTICSDQDGDCAKEDVLKVDEEDRKNTLLENGQNDEEASGDIAPATVTTSTYTTQRENGQNDEGATSDITAATATTSKLHLTEKPKVQWQNGPKTFCLRNHNTSHSYHSQQTLLFTVVLLLLYCINSKHM